MIRYFLSIAYLASIAFSISATAAESSAIDSHKGGMKITTTDVKNLAKEFVRNLSGQFALDPMKKEQIGNYQVPVVQNGDWILTDHPVPLVASFSARTNAIATIFVKQDEEFIVVSTSLTGSPPVLEHNTPAYKDLNDGKRFTGEVQLVGKNYMADFTPFRDKDGRVIGAYLVGIPL